VSSGTQHDTYTQEKNALVPPLHHPLKMKTSIP